MLTAVPVYTKRSRKSRYSRPLFATMQKDNQIMESSFVCNMNALDAIQTKRYKEITAKLNVERQAVKE